MPILKISFVFLLFLCCALALATHSYIRIAPEILLGIRSGNFVEYDHSVDWYSLGVVACRMLTKQVRNSFDWYTPILHFQGPAKNCPIERATVTIHLSRLADPSLVDCIEFDRFIERPSRCGWARATVNNDQAQNSSMNFDIFKL